MRDSERVCFVWIESFWQLDFHLGLLVLNYHSNHKWCDSKPTKVFIIMMKSRIFGKLTLKNGFEDHSCRRIKIQHTLTKGLRRRLHTSINGLNPLSVPYFERYVAPIVRITINQLACIRPHTDVIVDNLWKIYILTLFNSVCLYAIISVCCTLELFYRIFVGYISNVKFFHTLMNEGVSYIRFMHILNDY